MGTNYYRVNIPTEDAIEDCTLSIHICKISWGWQVGFDHNWGKYYQPTRDSLDEFLSQPNTGIKDEYGDILTLEEFWKEVDEHNSLSESKWVSKTYEEWEQERNPYFHPCICHEDIRKCRELFGVEPEMNDFQSGGLRFNVFSDFC